MTDNSPVEYLRPKRQTALVNFFGRLVKEQPLGTVGAAITLILLLTGIFADFLAPYGMNQTYVTEDHLSPPSAEVIFGTDDLGRVGFPVQSAAPLSRKSYPAPTRLAAVGTVRIAGQGHNAMTSKESLTSGSAGTSVVIPQIALDRRVAVVIDRYNKLKEVVPMRV